MLGDAQNTTSLTSKKHGADLMESLELQMCIIVLGTYDIGKYSNTRAGNSNGMNMRRQ